MARIYVTRLLGSWSAAVIMATGCASVAVVATAAVSVLADADVQSELTQSDRGACSRGGKRAVRAVDAGGQQFPDTCAVKYLPLLDSPLLEAARGLVPSVRPLHEAFEVPESFI